MRVVEKILLLVDSAGMDTMDNSMDTMDIASRVRPGLHLVCAQRQ